MRISAWQKVLMTGILAFGVSSLVGCEKKEEGPLEKAGKKLDEAAEEASDAIDDAADKANEAIDDLSGD